MPNNVGNLDRVIRVVAGLALLALFLVYPGAWWVWLTGAVGLVLVATGLVGTCPLYLLLGLSTAPRKEA